MAGLFRSAVNLTFFVLRYIDDNVSMIFRISEGRHTASSANEKVPILRGMAVNCFFSLGVYFSSVSFTA